ncbi:MAG: hypothetical protein ACKO96_21960, partial [Flammeovirgaceae bacterium]
AEVKQQLASERRQHLKNNDHIRYIQTVKMILDLEFDSVEGCEAEVCELLNISPMLRAKSYQYYRSLGVIEKERIEKAFIFGMIEEQLITSPTMTV